jgi:hypothetical protein
MGSISPTFYNILTETHTHTHTHTYQMWEQCFQHIIWTHHKLIVPRYEIVKSIDNQVKKRLL